MQYVLTMHMVKDRYTPKKRLKKIKNIVPKTPFFKDFPSTKKKQEQFNEFKYHWPPCFGFTIDKSEIKVYTTGAKVRNVFYHPSLF